METIPLIDLEGIAKQLKLPLPGVQGTAELLDEGNTVPFITRFRKDQTGGLDEPQIRAIETEVNRAKLLAERKEAILKSIESRGKLTDKLASQIKKAKVLGDLEDIYLPYKPKKQSLASIARARGLEPLATAVLDAKEATPSLEERAAAFVDPSKEVPDVETVMEGLKHLIAEHFGHHRQLRAQLRRHLSKHGRLVSKRIEQPSTEDHAAVAVDKPDSARAATSSSASEPEPATSSPGSTSLAPTDGSVSSADAPSNDTDTGDRNSAEASDTLVVSQASASETGTEAAPDSESGGTDVSVGVTSDAATSTQTESTESIPADATTTAPDPSKTEESPTPPKQESGDSIKPDSVQPTAQDQPSATKSTSARAAGKKDDATSRRDQRREMRRRRRDRLVQSFKDYFDFSDPIGRVPHHRILAINRGERTKVLRVKIECSDWDKVQVATESTAIPTEHPYADFLRTCLQDAMQRLLQPSIEREVRRELNDRAEEHAVTVFARNLRKLLLQPPLRQHRVVAIDPGFRSGCKLVALDEFGQILGHTFINLLGKDQQKQSGREALASFVQQHKASVVAVGNGAACRETETLVAEVLSNELKDQQVGYLIVNEAGTSVYSTSELGREELPDVDATVRSAVSIGRRSLDPLSELVKIDPASIGVGLYQHDVKAKHLRESLDAVVESCVNYVGVNVNSASPALLGYVSGLNSLTARKIYEHRQANGPFKNREQLKDVSGIGDSTYVQAAGFLRIVDGENPLDGTWIHPESYEAATKVLEAIGFSATDLQASPVDSPPAGTNVTAQSPDDTSSKVAESSTAPPSTEPASANERSEESDSPAAPADAVEASVSEVGAVSSEGNEVNESVAVEASAAQQATAGGSTTAESADRTADSDTASNDATATTTPAKSSSPTAELAARLKELTEKLSKVNVDELAPQLGVGKLSLQHIVQSLARPGRDPREDLPPPIFRTGVLKLEDLKPEMELSGTVLNVVDFGAFVDIGLVDSGLIHVSRLADRYISDPHDVVSVGDILRVWVVDVDQKRRRVSLTAIEPGTEKPKPSKDSRRRRPRNDSGDKSSGRQGGGKQAGRSGGRQGAKGKKFSRGKGQQRPNQYRPKAPPKPVVPITKEMEEGSEPMRTFGDLKQLFEKKKRPDSK